jgi:hypothetical protein
MTNEETMHEVAYRMARVFAVPTLLLIAIIVGLIFYSIL